MNDAMLSLLENSQVLAQLQSEADAKQWAELQQAVAQRAAAETQLGELLRRHKTKIDAAKLVLDEAKQTLDEAKQALAEARGGRADEVIPVETARDAAGRAIRRLLPASVAQTVADLEHLAGVIRAEARDRSHVTSGGQFSEGLRLVEASNVQEISGRLGPVQAATGKLRGYEVAPRPPAEMRAAAAEIRRTFRLDHMPGVRQVVINHT